MKRFASQIIIVATLIFACFGPWFGRAQVPMRPGMSPPGRVQDVYSPVLGAPEMLPPPNGQMPPAKDQVPAPAKNQVPPPTKDQVLPPPGQIPMQPPSTGQGVPVNLKNPELQETDIALPINLAAALRLADARPLIVAAAQASAWVAEAQLARAKVLWVPNFNFGFDYYRHDGFGPDLNRGVNTAARPLNQNDNFLYAGGGFTNINYTTDMIFAPLAARQYLKARRYDIQSAKNDALLQTATSYFEVHRYRGKYAGALDVVDRGRKLVERITKQSEDFVPRIEIDRAKNALADFEQQAASAREEWRVHSADFTRVLRLDPRTVVMPLEPDHLQITLIEPSRPLEDLIPIGLTNRPELASQQAIVQAVIIQIRQEKFRPLLPSLWINGFQTPWEFLQFGAQGIGNGANMNFWSWRNDPSVQPIWQVESMGLGNLARVKEQRATQSRELVELFKVQDGVAAEVVQSQARLQSAAVRVLQADRALREALITYEGNYEGLRQTFYFPTKEGKLLVQVYRPQEAVAALEHLKMAYDQYFSTIADYNRSQFQMFRALGYPANEIALHRTPGEPVPVDTNRPAVLPPVGNGPPPAIR